KRAGLSISPRRGFWKLTDSGFVFAKRNKNIPPAELSHLADVDKTVRLRASDIRAAADFSSPALATEPAKNETPEDRIAIALVETGESVAQDLLENIGRAPPEFFEQLVLHLLHVMGYGTHRGSLQRIGDWGRGGIDAVISFDRLGLEKVYLQARRWPNPV